MRSQEFVELLPWGCGMRLDHNAHARLDDLRAEHDRQPTLLQESQRVFQAAAAKDLLVRR